METTISSLITGIQNSPSFANQYAIALSVYFDQSCATTDGSATAVPITIHDILGPFVIFGFMSLFASIGCLFGGFWKKYLHEGKLGWRAMPVIGLVVVAIWGPGEKIVGEEDEPEGMCASLDGSQGGLGSKSMDGFEIQ